MFLVYIKKYVFLLSLIRIKNPLRNSRNTVFKRLYFANCVKPKSWQRQSVLITQIRLIQRKFYYINGAALLRFSRFIFPVENEIILSNTGNGANF